MSKNLKIQLAHPVMEVGAIQAMIKYNKVQIRNLETEKQYLEYLVARKYWPNCIPNDFGVISQFNYKMLNKAKDEIREIKRKLKLLAQVQYALKYSIR